MSASHWLKPYIQKVLRRAFHRTSFYSNALTKARVNRKLGRTQFGYICAHCGNVFTRKEVQVDHTAPVIPPGTLPIHMSYDMFIGRLFTENLQVLCKPCHHVKSAGENAIRRAVKKGKEDATKATR